MTRTILFDLDGTLVDSRTAIARSLRHALASHGFQVPDDATLQRHIGPPLEQALVQILRALGADVERAPELLVTYRERYAAKSVEETPAFAGVAELLASLAGQRLAVVTSKPRPYAVPILEARGLAGYFAHIEGPTLEARSEEKAVTLGRALHTLGNPGDVVMIGDRHHDVHAARAHGVRTIGILWGIGERAELEEAGADELVASVDELRARLSGSGTSSG